MDKQNSKHTINWKFFFRFDIFSLIKYKIQSKSLLLLNSSKKKNQWRREDQPTQNPKQSKFHDIQNLIYKLKELFFSHFQYFSLRLNLTQHTSISKTIYESREVSLPHISPTSKPKKHLKNFKILIYPKFNNTNRIKITEYELDESF